MLTFSSHCPWLRAQRSDVQSVVGRPHGNVLSGGDQPLQHNHEVSVEAFKLNRGRAGGALMRGWSRQKESMEPMQRTGSPVWKVCKGGRGPGATSLCRLCWPEGWSQGMLKAHPGCGPSTYLFRGPWENNTRRHSRGPQPIPALGTGCIQRQSKTHLRCQEK